MSEAVKKLTESEFYTTYGVSLLVDNVDKADQELLAILVQSIAERYRDITLYALRDELRHFVWGGDETDADGEYVDENLAILSNRGISDDFSLRTRNSLDLDTIIYLFGHGTWCEEYGGEAWECIAKACKRLIKMLPVTRDNIKKVVSAIDRLNDLEHNNDLYLSDFSEFELYKTLEKKSKSTSRQIFAESDSDVKRLARQYRGVLK